MNALIRTHDLTKRYGDRDVVSGLDLEVAEGRVYGFLGPNGAGKSTTMKLLLGLTRPTAGTIEVLGRDLQQHRGEVLPRIGSLVEGPAFLPRLTGRENVALVADYLGAAPAAVDWAIATVGLVDAAGRRAGQYSLGMKQRLGIAIALVGAPRLLLLDEPTNGLDPAGVVEIRGLVVDLARRHGITVLVSSHLLTEIEQMADDVGIIQGGVLRYQGPLAGLGDEGRLVFRVSDPAAAAAVLARLGVHATAHGAELTTPLLPDALVVSAVDALVRAGHGVARVEHRRTTLEERFLQLTDPAAAPARRVAPAATAWQVAA